MSLNVHDPKHVKMLSRRERRARERELSDVKQVMGTEYGRRFIYRLLAMSGQDQACFDRDINMTNFLLGQRNLGLMVKSDVMASCPEQYFKAIEEANKFLKREQDAEEAFLASTKPAEEEGTDA